MILEVVGFCHPASAYIWLSVLGYITNLLANVLARLPCIDLLSSCLTYWYHHCFGVWASLSLRTPGKSGKFLMLAQLPVDAGLKAHNF